MRTRKLYALHTRLMVPAFMINSLPKAGTHLLTKLVRLFPGVRYGSVEIDNATVDKLTAQFGQNASHTSTLPIGVDWPVPLPVETVRSALRSIPKGRLAMGHIPYSAEFDSVLSGMGMKSLLMVRDPRDVVVSHARFLATNETHFLYDRYQALSPADQLMASITGLEPSGPGEPGLLDIGTRCRSLMPWTSQPTHYTTSFEKLVGPRGGGVRDAQLAEIARIADHIGLRHSRPLLEWIADRVFGGTHTFRKGIIGSWHEHYSAEHKRAFKTVAGSILIDWGYERDEDW